MLGLGIIKSGDQLANYHMLFCASFAMKLAEPKHVVKQFSETSGVTQCSSVVLHSDFSYLRLFNHVDDLR